MGVILVTFTTMHLHTTYCGIMSCTIKYGAGCDQGCRQALQRRLCATFCIRYLTVKYFKVRYDTLSLGSIYCSRQSRVSTSHLSLPCPALNKSELVDTRTGMPGDQI